MGKYQTFEDLPVWQEAARLYQRVLDLLEENNLPVSAFFRGQLERSALAVCSQAAAGFDRSSPSETLEFLKSARAAAAELQSMVTVAGQRPKLARLREPLQQIRALGESCGRQLGAWCAAIEHPGSRNRSGTVSDRNGGAEASGVAARTSAASPAERPRD